MDPKISLIFVILAAVIPKSLQLECPAPGKEEDIVDGDVAWVIVAAGMVLLMTPGLAFFYGGLVRKKNVINTIMMSYVAMGAVALHWVLVGYTWSFGPGSTGWGDFSWGGLKDVGAKPNADYAGTIPHLAFMNFQMMFAIITPALISGGIVERMQFKSYILFILIWTTVVYDPLAHWVWSAYSEKHEDGTCEWKLGWLRKLGAIDFAGGTVIHISSGFSALIASWIIGKRRDYDPTKPIAPSNVPFVMLGGGLLWFGWLGFNGGSALAANSLAVLAATNTSIAAAAAFLTWLALDSIFAKRPSAVGAVTGAVVGMVAITPASGYILPGWSIIVGMVGVLFVYGALQFKKYLRVDDTLDVFFCHGIGGVVGALLTGLFATKRANPTGPNGAFYGNGELLGWQIVAVLISISLSTVMTAVILIALKYTIGLRTVQKIEEDGLDAKVHKEEAFEEPAYLRKLSQRALSGISSHNSSQATTPRDREKGMELPKIKTESSTDLLPKEKENEVKHRNKAKKQTSNHKEEHSNHKEAEHKPKESKKEAKKESSEEEQSEEEKVATTSEDSTSSSSDE